MANISSWLPLTTRYPLSQTSAVAPFSLFRGGFFSSLRFAGLNTKRPEYRDPKQLLTTPDFELWQLTGLQLDQSDADVFLGLIKLAMVCPVCEGNVPFEFDARKFLAQIDRTGGDGDKKWLRGALTRLESATFKLVLPPTKGGRVVLFSILNSAVAQYVEPKADIPSSYFVAVNAEIATVFADGFAIVNMTQRAALRGQPLAQWLHSFYATHRDPRPIGHEKLRALSGRGEQQDSKWIETLTDAAEALKTVTGWATCDLDQKTGVFTVNKKVSATRPKRRTKAERDSNPTGKRARLAADAAVTAHCERMTPSQLMAFKAIDQALPIPVDLKTVPAQRVETALFVLGAPPVQPELRERVIAVHAALLEALA